MPNRHKKFELSPRLRLGVGRGYSKNQIFKIGTVICLILGLFLTLHAFKLIFSGNKDSSSNTSPQVLGASDTKATDTVQFIDYTVKQGDTLFNISQKFNITWTTLATLNNLKSPFTLKSGQNLRIPK